MEIYDMCGKFFHAAIAQKICRARGRIITELCSHALFLLQKNVIGDKALVRNCFLSISETEVIGVTFLTPAPVPKKVTPAPAPELIGSLHSDSSLHSKSLKAESILPHEVNNCLNYFAVSQYG